MYNDHLGLIVSGRSEEQNNIDANILKYRNSLFAMLGPAFAYKCLLSSFHNKILRGFLKLSSHSPLPGLYFLLGELPIEAKVHISVFSLFYTILSNPETTLHQIAQYLARMTEDSSTTWKAHLRILSKKYAAPKALPLLENNGTPLSKDYWKTLINTI
jgi:hypothetical protein